LSRLLINFYANYIKHRLGYQAACLASAAWVRAYRVPGSAAAASAPGGTATTLAVSNLTASQPAITTAAGTAGPYRSQPALARHGIS
jgi:hypothetical protein